MDDPERSFEIDLQSAAAISSSPGRPSEGMQNRQQCLFTGNVIRPDGDDPYWEAIDAEPVRY